MEKARKMTSAEVAALPWGGVVWYESHTTLDCGKYGKHDAYNIYPMLVAEPGKNGVLGHIDRENENVIEINNISESDIFWNVEPGKEQVKNGIPIDEALKIFNKYEAEIFG